jgi:RNA polymerase sigma-70 factor (ECF subfamily)
MAWSEAQRLGQWYDAHAARLVLYARQWAGPAAAEDVVQEVFLRLLAKPPEDALENEKAWLFTAVRRAAIDEQRSGRRRVIRERRIAALKPDWFERHPGELIDATAAQEALSAVPLEQREVIVLRIWGKLTLAEISQVLREPVSTLFSRYKTGLAAIRNVMEMPCKMKTS